MKFSTSSIIYMAALVAISLSPNSVVSSSSSSIVPFLPSPDGGHLTLSGLDRTEPLTQDEASFLEETIRDVFNKIHKDNGVDLIASSVFIEQDAIIGDSAAADDKNNNSSTDNDNRSLLRGSMGSHRQSSRKLPNDHEMCDYQSGPLKGQVIPGCKFDIEFYMDCSCNLCDDDNAPQFSNHPSAAPSVNRHSKFFKFQAFDDDTYNEFPRNPTPAPTKLTAEPSAAPSSAPSPGDDISDEEVSLEVDRGPSEPIVVTTPNPMEVNILNKLKKSPFSRFKRVKNVSFGGN